MSGIVNARSGSRLTVITGRDNAFTGIANQRVNQISDDVYGEKSLTSYLNRAAFEQPAQRGVRQPRAQQPHGSRASGRSTWRCRGCSPFGAAQTVEVRIESFNVLNHFNWGNPTTNFSQATFGRIQSQAGDPRIMQFGVKYGF